MSRHPWWTPSGMAARLFRALAERTSRSDNPLFLPMVCFFGLTEIFGIWRGAYLGVQHTRKMIARSKPPKGFKRAR